ncbi:MAG TPA: glycosyltransferase family A protein [Gemmataceae bacterium]|jgi:hypothetical protein|nr:glycosyltransferase family A protein [Gemmataceae bacterium]
MKRFTIGIPTYNRAGFLRKALECALDQTYPNVEVVVSDNASTDETPEVVRSFGDRVRYHRNASNIGSWPNLVKLTELANGDYFSWLQDDDRIHRDFVRRAVDHLDTDDRIVMYAAYVVDTPSYGTFILPALYGPPIAMDWMRSSSRIVEGAGVAPISYFCSFAVPPVTAYRTEAIQTAAKFARSDCVLFNERIVQCRAVVAGLVAVDPWPAGIFYKHSAQDSLLSGSADPKRWIPQWLVLARELGRLLGEHPHVSWPLLFQEWIDALAESQQFILSHVPPVSFWPELDPLSKELMQQFLKYVPIDVQRWWQSSANESREGLGFKQIGKSLTPPIIWNSMSRMRSFVRNAGATQTEPLKR